MSSRADPIPDKPIVRYKVIYKEDTKRVSDLQSYAQLYAYVQKEFPVLGNGFKLVYEDSDKDLITMSHQEDFELALEECGALVKVLVQEDLEKSTLIDNKVMAMSMAQVPQNNIEEPIQSDREQHFAMQEVIQVQENPIVEQRDSENKYMNQVEEETKVETNLATAPDAQNVLITKVDIDEIEGIEPEPSVNENVITYNLEQANIEQQSDQIINQSIDQTQPVDQMNDVDRFNMNLQVANKVERSQTHLQQPEVNKQPINSQLTAQDNIYSYDQVDVQSQSTNIKRVDTDVNSIYTDLESKQISEQILFDVPDAAPRMTNAEEVHIFRKKQEQEQLMELGKLSNELMHQNEGLKVQVTELSEQNMKLLQENDELKKDLMKNAHNDLKDQRMKSSNGIKLCWKCDGMGVSSNKKGLPCKKCKGSGKIQSEMVKELDEYIECEIEKLAPVAFKKMLIMYNNMGKGFDNKAEHDGIKCSVCGTTQIRGSRYGCNVCPDFNICEECEQGEGHTHKHAMTIIRYPYLSNGYAPPSIPEQIIPSADDLLKKAAEQARNADIKGMGKQYSAKFEKESFPDKTAVEQGKPFTKTWTFQNDGRDAWSALTMLTYQNGIEFGQKSVQIGKVVEPNQSVDVTIECSAPQEIGNYHAFYRLEINDGSSIQQFGPKVWIDVTVEDSKSQSMGLKSLMEPNQQVVNQSVQYNAINNFSSGNVMPPIVAPQKNEPSEASAFQMDASQIMNQSVQQQQQFQGWNANFAASQQNPQQQQFANYQQPAPSQQQKQPQQPAPQSQQQPQQPMWQSQQWNAASQQQQQQQQPPYQQFNNQQQPPIQQQQPMWQSQQQPQPSQIQPSQQQQPAPAQKDQNQFQPLDAQRPPRASMGLCDEDFKKISYSEKVEKVDPKFKGVMQQLMDIGFLEYDKNLALTQKYNGDITKILGELC